MKRMKNWTIILICLASCTTVQEYSTCESWDELVAGNNFHYVTPVRVSDPGSMSSLHIPVSGFMTNSNLIKPAGMHLA